MTADQGLVLSALAEALGRAPRWEELALLRNVAPVPPLQARPGDTPAARGFHAALLDGQGGISHYAKCRGVDDPRAARESELLRRLARSRAASRVPAASVMRGETLQVLVLGSVAGVRLDQRLRRHPERAPEDAAAVLEAMDEVRTALEPGNAPVRSFDPGPALGPWLQALAGAGVESETLATLGKIASGSVPWVAQHGDLWPANIIWGVAGPVLLDFEAYGEFGHPMFDAWHLIRGCQEQPGEPGSWLGLLTPRTPLEEAWRRLAGLRQAEAGLGGTDLLSGLVWYAVAMAGTLLQRGVPERFWRPFVDDVRRVAALGFNPSLPP